MAEVSKEAKRDIVSERAGRTIQGILVSEHIDPLIASTFSDLVLSEELGVNIAELQGVDADAAFHLHVGRLDGFGFVVDPYLSIDIERGLTASQDEFTSELVREVLLAVQYPDHGFERSMREVYADAFQAQAAFLNSQGIGPVKNDPRTTDHDELFYQLSYASRYFNDPSFDMYERALARMPVSNESEEKAKQAIRGDKRFFVKARELVSTFILDDLDKSLYEREDKDRAPKSAAVTVAGQAIRLKEQTLLA